MSIFLLFSAKINETDTFGPGDDDEIQFDDIGDDDEDIDDVSRCTLHISTFVCEVSIERPALYTLTSFNLRMLNT